MDSINSKGFILWRAGSWSVDLTDIRSWLLTYFTLVQSVGWAVKKFFGPIASLKVVSNQKRAFPPVPPGECFTEQSDVWTEFDTKAWPGPGSGWRSLWLNTEKANADLLYDCKFQSKHTGSSQSAVMWQLTSAAASHSLLFMFSLRKRRLLVLQVNRWLELQSVCDQRCWAASQF